MIKPKFFLHRVALSLCLFAANVTSSSAATFEAGPGQTYTNLSSVPWAELNPGDTVNIHCQPGGYHEIILLSNSGVSNAPITLNGVPDPVTGALPMLDGNNAVTATNVPWSDLALNTSGVIVVSPAASQPYGYIPSWIVIQNLHVQNADPGNVLTQANGKTNHFAVTASAINVVFGQHLVVRACELNGSCNGLFCGSQNNDANQMSADLLIQSCWIHDNGYPGNYEAANLNTEARGIVCEYNLIGPLRAGAAGDQIKDSSAGTTLCYNQIIASPGPGTAFWFTQTRHGVGTIDADPAYHTNFVYGNLFSNPTNSTCTEMFRFDTLSIAGSPRNGTLLFYNNTVVNYADQSERYGTSLFDLPTAAEAAQWSLHDVLDCRNNIFANLPATAGGAPSLITFLHSDASTVTFGTNWITRGFQYFQLPYLSTNFTGTFIGSNQFIISKRSQSDPGFVSYVTGDFHLLSSSAAIDAAGPSAPASLASANNVIWEYVYPSNFQTRAVNGLGLDLGAFEGASTNSAGPLFTLAVGNGFGSGAYPAGAMVPIAASNAPAGQMFAGWTGSPVTDPSYMGTTLVMGASNLTVTATFTNVPAPVNYPLTVVNGSGSGLYLPGTVVAVTAATPGAGQSFSGWGGYPVANALAATTTLLMPAAPVTIIAGFQTSATFNLTVVHGSGGGSYLPGAVVGIVADAAPPQQAFSAWSGFAVSRSAAAATTLTMPSADVVVTANYLPVSTNGGGGVTNPAAGSGPTNPPAGTSPTNAILFVTQVPIPAEFTTIGSTFGNQQASPRSCGRGGDLYIRYPDGTLKNLTRAAGYGQYGNQFPRGIAVRQPCVHWSGLKAVFSMVIGESTNIYDNTTYYWQLYEITNFVSPDAIPVITKVPNQPANYNNIAPIYGSDDRIIFTSDRPRNGESQLYPQLDEYEEAPTVTGLWSLDPVAGDLFMVNHTPSGAFSPLLDSAGRIVFSRWDHLQRDQQADTDWALGNHTYGPFNWSDESAASVITTNLDEVFPEPRPIRTDLLAGTNLRGSEFNQFFPWAINQDGTDEETVNHIGRHEIGGSYAIGSVTDDPNVTDIYYGLNYNTNIIKNFLEPREDPRVPGLFYGIDSPEFGTHGSGQIVSLTGATNLNAYFMRISYLTPRSGEDLALSAATIPADDTGMYRNPLMTSDGFFIAAHTTNALNETGGQNVLYPLTNYPGSSFSFRLKFLQYSNGYYQPGLPLTPGLTNYAFYVDSFYGTLDLQTNFLWELEPVEVMARPRPVPYSVPMAAPEQAAFAAAKVDLREFQNYLATHQLALIVSRDVTTRDHADHQQPFNLRVAGSARQTIGAPGKIYTVGWLQLFQADQLRSLNLGYSNNPGTGRRVIAQYLHDPAVDNATQPGLPLASVPLAADGSDAALVPARRAMAWQLNDTNNTGVVRERYWLTFAPGEIRTCTSCHGINETTQANGPVPTNTPLALIHLLTYWKTNTAIQGSVGTNAGTNFFQITFNHRPAELGVTYHVQSSTNLTTWSDIASYSSTNRVLTAQAFELSRSGSPNESVTIRDNASINANATGAHFMRVRVTRP